MLSFHVAVGPFTEIAGDALGGGSGDELKDTFNQLASDAKVDAELQRLMAEMNGGAPKDAE